MQSWRIYSWNGTAWNQVGLDIDGEAESDGSGYSASMSSDGNVVAIGAARNDGTGTDAGHVRVYNAFAAKVSGNAGFRMLSSPVSGQVLGDLLTNAFTQGMTGANTTNGSANVWTFDLGRMADC